MPNETTTQRQIKNKTSKNLLKQQHKVSNLHKSFGITIHELIFICQSRFTENKFP